MFDIILEQYETDLRNYCRWLTGTPWDAEDLFQETIIKALKAQEKMLDHPEPKALLFRIASNSWIDECRKRKVQIGLPDGYDPIVEEKPDYLEINEALEIIVTLVPPYQAVVLLLVDVFTYPAREVAQMLETTEGAIKAALHRARKTIHSSGQNRTVTEHYGNINRKTDELITHFINAFRFQEPMGIAAAYLRLVKKGIKTEKILFSGKIHFSFRDVEGNSFTIMAE